LKSELHGEKVRIRMLQILFLLGLVSVLWLPSCRQREKERRPNVILFLIDDFGYGDISFEGNTQIRTPGIDRIAEGGARFTRFYQSSAACAPTRASLLTGRYHLETGVWDVHYGRDFLHRDETTIADALRQAGYATGAFGKWHSGKTWRYFSWNRGFDVGIHPVLYRYRASRALFNDKLVNFDGPVTDVIGREVLRFISEHRDRPFFAYVPFQEIHEPFNCPDEEFRKWKEAGYSDHVARMYGMTEVMDRNIGRILDALDSLGLAENTVVMFLSDDGPSPGVDLSYANRRMNADEIAERSRGWRRVLRGGKASIYEGGSITPFYIQWKGRIAPGSEHRELSGIIDIYPTILEICGVPLPEGQLPLAGRSLWPVLEGNTPEDWEERIYFDNTNFYRIPRASIDPQRPRVREISAHYRQYKFIRHDRYHYGADSLRYELYDLEAGPGETENIYGRDTAVATRLRRAAESWFDDVLAGGRAYGQAVYEVGNWAETATPINPDAHLELIGDLTTRPQAEFRFSGWTSPGSGMTFRIDALEAGEYRVQLYYSGPEAPSAATLSVYTEYDTTLLVVDHPASALSGVLRLPAGLQTLGIGVLDPGAGGEAFATLDLVAVHRVPGPGDRVLRGHGFELFADGRSVGRFAADGAALEFMRRGGQQDQPVPVPAGARLRIEPYADNPEELAGIRVFVDFEQCAGVDEMPYAVEIEAPAGEKYTLNVEFISGSGARNAARAHLQTE
jgi:arylsulfatase A-like enzyme